MQEHTRPGELIEELLNGRGWTKRSLAIVLEKGESTVNKIISGKSTVTTEVALALEDVFGVDAERFLELQRKYDLAVARISAKPDRSRATRAALFGDLPISAMVKRGWLGTADSKNLTEVSAELVKFFGVSSLDEIEILPHAARKTAVSSDPTPAQLAWLYRVRAIAREQIVGKFSKRGLDKAIGLLHTLTVAPEEARKVPRVLAEAGVRLVIVETLPAAKIDGVCFWLTARAPVVGLSMRHDRIDNFWFVLRHELEHVRLGHGRTEIMLDTELEGERAGTDSAIAEEERAANSAAQDFCVPKQEMDAFIARKAPLFSERDLRGFAKIVRVHPGIVAGQLQHLTGRFDRFRNHLVKVRSHVVPGAAVDGWGDVYPIGTQED